MRRALATTFAAALAALALAPAASTAAPARPVLRMVDTDPVTVKGFRFDPAATVRVRAMTFTHTWTKRVRVNAAGTFVVSFPLEAAGCGHYVRVHAIASDGARAAAVLPHFECPRD